VRVKSAEEEFPSGVQEGCVALNFCEEDVLVNVGKDDIKFSRKLNLRNFALLDANVFCVVEFFVFFSVFVYGRWSFGF
jgi:hypothetical protein